MKDFSDKIDTFIDENRMYHFEGERGVRDFEKLVEALGYGGHYGTAINQFLADNSGAIHAMVEWIKDCRCQDWNDNITAQLNEKEFEE